MPRDFGLRHSRIVFERQRRDRLVIFAAAPANAAETHDRADIGAAFGQRGDFPRDVEIGFLNTDGDRNSHRGTQPPVIGGKKAISPRAALDGARLMGAWWDAARS